MGLGRVVSKWGFEVWDPVGEELWLMFVTCAYIIKKSIYLSSIYFLDGNWYLRHTMMEPSGGGCPLQKGALPLSFMSSRSNLKNVLILFF